MLVAAAAIGGIWLAFSESGLGTLARLAVAASRGNSFHRRGLPAGEHDVLESVGPLGVVRESVVAPEELHRDQLAALSNASHCRS